MYLHNSIFRTYENQGKATQFWTRQAYSDPISRVLFFFGSIAVFSQSTAKVRNPTRKVICNKQGKLAFFDVFTSEPSCESMEDIRWFLFWCISINYLKTIHRDIPHSLKRAFVFAWYRTCSIFEPRRKEISIFLSNLVMIASVGRKKIEGTVVGFIGLHEKK